MKKNWFADKVETFSSIGGYKKPELHQDILKLDSNENYTIPKQFQNEIVISAKKNSDIREYPLGGVERLIKNLSEFIKINTKVTSSKKSLSEISKNLKTLTDAEGLPNHYEAVEGRLK